MPSATAFFVIFSVIIFMTGAAFGALVLFTVSIHRTRHAPLSGASGQPRGATSRSVRHDPHQPQGVGSVITTPSEIPLATTSAAREAHRLLTSPASWGQEP